MNLPKVKFLKDSELEESLAHYLCYLGKQIACGYYQDRRFIILPKPLSNYGRSVFFPDLKYPKSFWANASKYQQNDFKFRFDNPHDVPDNLVPTPEEVNRVEKNWQKYEKEFFETFQDVFPLFKINLINSINCSVSKFGTVGSFEFQNNKDGTYDFKFTHRADVKVSGIAEKIVSEFIYKDNPMLALGEWEIRENTVDFVLLKTKIGQIFNFDFQPTVTNHPELSENQVLESEKYFSKIGFPINSVFSISAQVLEINNQPVYNTFTQTEKRILICLTQNKNRLISYEEIGNLFWGEEASLEKFSLASIAKIMEKIRRKIKEHGVYQELIYTVRGQGYVLYD